MHELLLASLLIAPVEPSGCRIEPDGQRVCEVVRLGCDAPEGCPAESTRWDVGVFRLVSDRVDRIGHWGQPPRVVICPFAPVDELTVVAALEWWAARGHPAVLDAAGDCLEGEPSWGHVWLRLRDARAVDTEGEARLRLVAAEGGDHLAHASLYLPSEPVPWSVLLHELGHGFGFGHAALPGHVMSPRISELGDRDTDLAPRQAAPPTAR